MPIERKSKALAAGLGLCARLLFALPDPVLRRLFGSPPAEADGLMPDSWALCRLAGMVDRDPEGADPVAMRAETELLAQAASDRRQLPVESKDLLLGKDGIELPARLYVPKAAHDPGPLLIWFHGGGWVVGSLESHDASCRRLAHKTGHRVLAVDYRLAPEDPFPAAADDALTAWDAVEADPAGFRTGAGLIAVGGDSAGGNLAAVLCQDLQSAGRPQPRLQVLVYPVTEIGSQSQSMSDFESGYYLTRERMDFYDRHYMADGNFSDPRASPLLAGDLTGLAPAYVSTALADPLRDEGEQYARCLMAAGVKTTLDRLPLVHAWFNQTTLRSSRAAHEVLAARVRELS